MTEEKTRKLLFPGGSWDFAPKTEFTSKEGEPVRLENRVKLNQTGKESIQVSKEALIQLLNLPAWARQLISELPATGEQGMSEHE